MKDLLDKNGVVLEDGDLIIADEETNPEQVLKYSGIWYMANYPSEKGTLFNLSNFITKEDDSSVTLVDYTKFKEEAPKQLSEKDIYALAKESQFESELVIHGFRKGVTPEEFKDAFQHCRNGDEGCVREYLDL